MRSIATTAAFAFCTLTLGWMPPLVRPAAGEPQLGAAAAATVDCDARWEPACAHYGLRLVAGDGPGLTRNPDRRLGARSGGIGSLHTGGLGASVDHGIGALEGDGTGSYTGSGIGVLGDPNTNTPVGAGTAADRARKAATTINRGQ